MRKTLSIIALVIVVLFSGSAMAIEKSPWILFLPIIINGDDGFNDNGYKDNGNGTVTDQATWLMWQLGDNGNPICNVADSIGYCPYDAQDYCRDLVLGGYSDWRLPTKDELKSLVICSNGKPTPLPDFDSRFDPFADRYKSTCARFNGDNSYNSPTIDSTFKPASPSRGYYWSSSRDSWGSIGSPHYWTVHFSSGLTTNLSYIETHLVRCVRN